MNKSMFPTLVVGGVKAYSWRGGPVDELLLEFLSFHFPCDEPVEFSGAGRYAGVVFNIFKELPSGICINIFARGWVSLSPKVCTYPSTEIFFINEIVTVNSTDTHGVITRRVQIPLCEFKSFFENWANPKTEELDMLSLVYPEGDFSMLRSLVI